MGAEQWIRNNSQRDAERETRPAFATGPNNADSQRAWHAWRPGEKPETRTLGRSAGPEAKNNRKRTACPL